ncbi:MAG: family 1 glycosylhydrolase [Candidatus Dojkabacteria bacterium]|nr:MAG: family 1 glycosylhydrolase [Candidatus Dojkabacteria bacterium]
MTQELFANHKGIENRGFATSFFQESPAMSPDDIWGKALETKGVSPELRTLFDRYADLIYSSENGYNHLGKTGRAIRKIQQMFYPDSLPTKERLYSEVESYFDAEFDWRLKQYEIDGLASRGSEGEVIFNEDLQPTIVFHIDADIIEKADGLNNGMGEAFFGGLYNALSRSRSLGIKPTIFINQLARPDLSLTEDGDERFQRLTGLLRQRIADQGDEQATDILENLKYDKLDDRAAYDIEYWKSYLDRILAEGGNAFRISAEWSRLFDADNNLDLKNAEFFCEILREAKERGLDTTICLQHFTFPDWIEGDWSGSDTPQLFANYARNVAELLRERNLLPSEFLTVNEPSATIPAGYIAREWPPFKGLKQEDVLAILQGNYLEEARLLGIDLKPEDIIENLPNPRQWMLPRMFKSIRLLLDSYQGYRTAVNNMVEGHILARSEIKKVVPDARVGYSHNTPIFLPVSWKGRAKNIITTADSIFLTFFNDDFRNELLRRSIQSGELLTDSDNIQVYNAYYGAASIAANIARVPIDPDSPDKTFVNGWVEMPEAILIATFRRNITLLNTIEAIYRRQIREHGRIVNPINLPDVNFTEIGLPSLADPTDRLRRLLDIVELSKKLSLAQVDKVLIWTLRNNMEWLAGKQPFGLDNEDGTSKPKSKDTVEPIDYSQKGLLIEEAYIYQKRLNQMRLLMLQQGTDTAGQTKDIEETYKQISDFLAENDPQRARRRSAMKRELFGRLGRRLVNL